MIPVAIIDRNDKIISQCISALRLPLSIAVVVFHSLSINGKQLFGDSFNCSDYSLLSDIISINGAFLADMIVPVFFWISGYLFYNWKDSFSLALYKNKLQSRIHTLFIPYIIWNLLAIFAICIKELPIFQSMVNCPGAQLNFSLHSILSCFWAYDGSLNISDGSLANDVLLVSQTPYPVNTALWYCRDLMLVILITPLLIWAIRKMKSVLISFLAVIYGISWFSGLNFQVVQFCTAVFFFAWGAYSRMDSSRFDKQSGIMSIFLSVFLSLVYLYLTKSDFMIFARIVKVINTIIVVYACFALAKLYVSKCDVNGSLSGLAVFIFMSHCIILPRIIKVIGRIILPSTDMSYILVYLSSIIVTIVSIWLVYLFLRKYARDVLKLLIGRF
ncbi:MAG: acyltransferase family protein [Bacteroidales bacterium]|nr:acyltransferase family protein [Bacteroidales bacterium]